MVVGKRRSVRVVLALLLLVLAGSFFLAAQPAPTSASPLESLLSGSSTDIPGALSSLNDADLPLALAIAEALKFKALHGDTPLSAIKVDEFRQTLEKRLSESKIVSLTGSEGFPTAVSKRQVKVGGLELTVPAHFLAAQPLQITDFGPTGEAGTILPECWVSFVTTHQPVRAVMKINGNPVAINKMTTQTAKYQPPAVSGAVFSLGTHSVSVNLSDGGEGQASASWSFTIGVHPVPTDPIPLEARFVGSFSIEISRLVENPTRKLGLRVEVFETADGRRFIEYVLHQPGDPDRPIARTRDPFWVRKILTAQRAAEYSLKISPKTPVAFPGNLLTFSATHNVPNASVEKITWKVSEGGPEWTETSEEVKRTLKKPGFGGECTMVLSIQLPDDHVSEITLTQVFGVKVLWVDGSWPSPRALLNSQGKGIISFTASRKLGSGAESGGLDLLEGQAHDLGGGTLTVKKAILRLGSGSGPHIANPTALEQNLLFENPGFCEIVHDVALAYRFEDEDYSANFEPKESFLVGAFKTNATIGFSQVPPGIIMATSRKVTVSDIALTINGDTRHYSLSDQPNWEIARSSLFPEQTPIQVEKVLPGFGGPAGQIAWDFRPIAFLVDEAQIENGTAEFKPVFRFFLNCTFVGEDILSTANALKIPAYGLDEELLTAQIEPSPLPTLFEGQNLIVDAVVTPREGLGTGMINSQGGTIDILDGYQLDSVSMVHWDHWLHEEAPPERVQDVNWSYDFRPKDGSGTYSVYVAVGVRLKESETEDTVTVYGSGNEQVLVKPGLRILSPVARVVYPQGSTISVSTTFDKDSENWKKTRWMLNGKLWLPGGDEGPASLFLENSGKQILKAELTIPPPRPGRGNEVTLMDEVKFQVHPVQITLDPGRKVFPFSTGIEQPLSLMVKLKNAPVTELHKPIPWVDKESTVEVEMIEWLSAYSAFS